MLAKISNGICDNLPVSPPLLPPLLLKHLALTFSTYSSNLPARSLSQTSLLRALDPSTTKTYLFPAMNTLMYTHPLTAKQLRVVKDEIGYEVHGPQAGKALACGDIG
jgi:phosphopantothenoylcysteine synthetase/decarboxylase